MIKLLTFAFCLLYFTSFATKPKHHYIKIKTEMGECIIMLYNQTPLHRDNFIKLAKRHVFDGMLFHRVIKNFMVQGGDPDSKKAGTGSMLGNGSVGYTIPAEVNDSLFHKKGVLGAARDDNPKKESSGSQFYIVQGKKFTDQQLDELEHERLNFKLPLWQRDAYKAIGGSPHLDQNYTVFGEVIQGIDLVDRIAEVVTDPNDRPTTDIKTIIRLLKRHEAKKFEKQHFNESNIL